MSNNSATSSLLNVNMKETTINNHLQLQNETIDCVVLYLEILHWSFKFDGIYKANVG